MLSDNHYYNKTFIEPNVDQKIDEFILRSSYSSLINFTIYKQHDAMFKIRNDITPLHINHIRSEYLHHLHQLSWIPKKLHISWPNKNVLNSSTKIIEWGLKSFKKLNPDWKLLIYNDNEIEEYIQSKVSVMDYNLIKTKHIVEKIDLWRLLIIYFEGGMYADLDRLFNVKMTDLIGDRLDIKMLLPTHYDINFSQDFMCSASLNVLFKLAIELNLSKRRIMRQRSTRNDINGSNLAQILSLGPDTYWQAVTKSLFGILTYDGGDDPKKYQVLVAKMRDVIGRSECIKTYRETWCDTIVYHTDNLKECQSISKEDLWEETNKKHWELEIEK